MLIAVIVLVVAVFFLAVMIGTWTKPALPTWQVIANRRAKRATEAELTHLLVEFPNVAGVLIEWAERAVRDLDWPQVVLRAETLRSRFPDDPSGYLLGARGLMRTGALDDAQTLLQASLRIFPQHLAIAAQYALCAEEQKDWNEAWGRWQKVQQCFPDRVDGFFRGGLMLIKLDRREEADSMLGLASDRFPTHWEAALRHAQLAHRRGDWIEADRRWAAIRGRFDTRPEGYLNGSEALQKLGRLDEAARVIANGAFLFPKNKAMQLHHQCIRDLVAQEPVRP